MSNRVLKGLGAAALVSGSSLGVLPATTVSGAQVAPLPVADRLPSIVTQLVGQLTGPARFARDPQATARLSNTIVHVDTAGRIELSFHTNRPATTADAASLAALGATGIAAPPLKLGNVGIVQAWVPASSVASAAALPWVKAVTAPSYGATDVGSVTSEGVAFHGADVAQAAGVNGAGVNVGVVSDGVTNIAASQALGDLPNTVNVLNAGSGDEGTAMLEIVQDMAPGAGLLFNGTGGGVANHVNALNNLVANGANVIAEDIPFDAEPAFQKGLAAQTGENIAAGGVSVHSSAGNEGARHAARVTATGTGQRPDNTANMFAGCANTPDNVVDIDPGAGTAFDVAIFASAPMAANGTLTATLQWSEPRAIFPTVGQGGFTDLNLYVMNSGLTQCLAQSTAVQANGTGDTLEQVSFTAAAGTSVKLVVDVEGTSSAVAAPTLDLRWRGASAIDNPTRAGSLNPDSNYTNGLATSSAALNALNGNIEGFSSGGPVQLGSTTTCPGGGAGPCAGVAGGGLTSSPGPTWAAADNVQVTGVGGFGSPFTGTSAAAPHAAACEALIRQNTPGLTVAQARARLIASATDVAPAGTDNVTGAGQLVCKAQPTVMTTATVTSVVTATSPAAISDSATLANGFSPTGTIRFQAFGPNDALCAAAAAFTNDKAVNGNGVYASDPFSPASEGVYRWVVTYLGNANNLPATSPCNAMNETSTVATVCAAPPPPGTLPGNNIVIAAPGLVTVGTAGNDVIYGTAGDDRIFGAGGDDIIFAGGGSDWVTGGDGKDTLCGGDGNDRLTGDAGDDLVVGGNGTDDLTGLAGNDRVIGGTGIVRIDGGDGTDTCTSGTGAGSTTVRCESIVP